ncbi:hypothetical protein DV736_g5126, partial [Chaetothyriales sp. CBS 134916]
MGLLWQPKKRKAASNLPQETSHDLTQSHPQSHPGTDSDLSESAPVPSFPDGVKVLRDCPDATPKLNKARMLTYGYDAYVVRKSVAGSNRLIDHATNLLNDLTADRADCNAPSRPIIFVAHSLSGLVCKKAILLSRNDPEDHLRAVFNCTNGIIFMGTPHRGAWMADWAKIPGLAIGLVKTINKSLLDILETNNQLLESIQVDFWRMIRKLQNDGRTLEVTCFFEELPLNKFGKVVSKESATLEGYNAFSIYANTWDMPFQQGLIDVVR